MSVRIFGSTSEVIGRIESVVRDPGWDDNDIPNANLKLPAHFASEH